jgi:predicted NBD/HSP70 family sugar kinase
MTDIHTPSDGAVDLLRYLRDGRPLSRARLADLSGVARSTIAIRADELASLGLIEPETQPVYSGGRPSTRIALSPRARLVLTADIGATHAAVALLDLLGGVIAKANRTLGPEDDPVTVLEWLVEEGEAMLAAAGATGRLAAVGVGLAAPIEHASRKPIAPPVMPKWDGFSVGEWLENRLHVRTLVEKDVNLMVLGERAARWPTTENLLFVKMATGIGAGMIVSGQLHRGEQGTAGDIGHVQVNGATDAACHCGNHGCLEAIASGPALARQLTDKGVPATSSADILALIRAGNLDAIQAVRQAGRHLGEVLASTVSLLNPAVVVIGGPLSEAGEHLLAGARELIYARSMPLSTQRLTVVQADPSVDVAILGAGILAADYALTSEGLQGMNRERTPSSSAVRSL